MRGTRTTRAARRTLRAAAFGVACAASLGTAASAAADTQPPYVAAFDCEGVNGPAEVEISTGYPASPRVGGLLIPAGAPLKSVGGQIKVSLPAGDDTAFGTNSAVSVQARFTSAGRGATITFGGPGEIATTAASTVFTSTTTPAPIQDAEPGPATLTLNELTLTTTFRDSFGLPSLRSYRCQPPSENRTLATFQIGPASPYVEDVTATTATVCATGGMRPMMPHRYVVFDGALKLGTSTTSCQSITGLTPGKRYTLTVKSAIILEGHDSDTYLLDEGDVSFTTLAGPLQPTVKDVSATSVTVCAASTLRPAVLTNFVVFDGDREVGRSQSLCQSISGLTPATAYKLTVMSAMAGSSDATLQLEGEVSFRTLAGPVGALVTVKDVTGLTATVCDSGAVRPPAIYRYVVFDGTKRVGTSASPCQVISGLRPGKEYTLILKVGLGGPGVDSEDETGLSTVGSVSFETAAGSFEYYTFGATGTATLKTLTKGSIPLTGMLKRVNLIPSTGEFTADLELQRSTANLVALGFLPVRAEVLLAPTESMTGTLTNGDFDSRTKARIKVPSVTVFGIPLAGGATCQARQVSSLALRSTETFFPTVGGTIAGTFAISDLAGCGALTGLVSPLTAGANNAIALNLKPQPAI